MQEKQFSLFDAEADGSPVIDRTYGVPFAHYGRENRNATYHETKPKHSGDRLRVLEWLRSHPEGGTREEIAAGLCIPVQTVCGRMRELLDEPEPAVIETPERRPTRNGRTAVVCKAVER